MKLFYKHSVMQVGIALICLYGTAQAGTIISAPSADVITYDATKTITITPTSSTANPTFEAWTTGSTPSCAIVSSSRTSVTYSALHPTTTVAPVIGCTIHISQAGDGITPSATKDIPVTVLKAAQTIATDGLVGATAGQPSILWVSSSGSDKPITVGQNGNCPVDINASPWTVTPAISGSCTFYLSKKGDEYYNDVVNYPVTFTIAKGNTVIDFTNPPNQLVLQYNKPYSLTVKKTGSTATLTGATSTGSICSVSTTPTTISPFIIKGTDLGVCKVIGAAAGSAYYNGGSNTLSIQIIKADQKLTITRSGSGNLNPNQTDTITITTDHPGTQTDPADPVLVSVADNTICSISGSGPYTIKGLKGGNCQIQANQAGNTYYNAGTASLPITINKLTPTLTVTGNSPLEVAQTEFLTITPSGSVNPASLSVQDTTVCRLTQQGSTSAKIEALRGGNCVITAFQAGDSVYSDFTLKPVLTVTLTKMTVPIVFNYEPIISVGKSDSPRATPDSANNGIIFSTTSTDCQISTDATTGKQIVTGKHAGNNNCVISANRAENDYFLAFGPVNQTISVGQAPITITPVLPTTMTTATPVRVSASSIGLSDQQLTISVLPSGPCSIVLDQPTSKNNAAATITGNNAGNCSVTFSQAGNADYAGSSITQIIQIQGSQTITFDAPAPIAINAGPATLTASASSGLTVSLISTTPATCLVSGNTASLLKIGTCSITASQDGNANYLAATPVTRTLTILPPPANVSISSSANPVMIRKNVTLSATVAGSTPTGSVSFIVDSVVLATCNAVPVVNGVATCTTTKLKAGKRSIVASYSGDANNQSSQSAPFVQTVRSLDWLNTLLNQILD